MHWAWVWSIQNEGKAESYFFCLLFCETFAKGEREKNMANVNFHSDDGELGMKKTKREKVGFFGGRWPLLWIEALLFIPTKRKTQKNRMTLFLSSQVRKEDTERPSTCIYTERYLPVDNNERQQLSNVCDELSFFFFFLSLHAYPSRSFWSTRFATHHLTTSSPLKID